MPNYNKQIPFHLSFSSFILETMITENQNRLKTEPSPYLRQHAENPVHWFAWNDDAFKKAAEEDKPIFLSIGYSTCHWCHVMAHESFEDEAVANLLNRHFISVKVDREERPDVDQFYMTACQLMTGTGGWPLTIIMTPDKKPFFAGTYFPKESRGGRIGFMELLERVAQSWASNRNELFDAAEHVTRYIAESDTSETAETIDLKTAEDAYRQLHSGFDAINGGFGNAPKFPTPHQLLFLFRYWKRTGNTDARTMALKTLTAISRGGIWDHIGFGFHRYSTDKNWHLPHFEKMLYDQAMLLLAFTEAWQITKDPEYHEVMKKIITYVDRDLHSPEGGCYCAEDADSEGEEGRFYVWSWKELETQLSSDQLRLAQAAWGLRKNGNFREEATGHETGLNIPHQQGDLPDIANAHSMTPDAFKEELETIRKVLYAARMTRVRPGLDDKILTDWNGLMIAALAKYGRATGDIHGLTMAENAATFILTHLYDKEANQLFHRFRNGHVGIEGNAGDYLFLIWGLLELYQATRKPSWLKTADRLLRRALTSFWDKDKQGFFLTAATQQDVIVRQKDAYDGALPSINAVGYNVLYQLAMIKESTELQDLARQQAAAFSARIRQYPSAFTFWLSVFEFETNGGTLLIVSSASDNGETTRLLETLNRDYHPHLITISLTNENRRQLEEVAPALAGYKVPEVSIPFKAYICRDFTCHPPVSTQIETLKILKNGDFKETPPL